MGISWKGNKVGGGGVISITTIDRGRVVGALTLFLVLCVWVWYSAGWELARN